MRKKSLLCSLIFFFSSLTGLAQEASTPSMADVQRLGQIFSEFSLSKAQTQEISSIVLSQLPYILDPDTDLLARSMEVAPQVYDLLNPSQRKVFIRLAQESAPILIGLGSMDKHSKRVFIENSLKQLKFPGIDEWINRAKSLER